MTQQQLEKRIQLLTAYAGIITVLILILFITSFSNNKTKFDEIDVERINVREPSGQIALVIANEAQIPGNIINDLEYSDRMGEHGIVFYNSEGDEAGALLLHTNKSDSGGVEAFSQLSLDRFEGDQVVALRYFENTDYYSSGLRVSD